jgi:catalase
MATRKNSTKSSATRSSKPSRRSPSGADNQTLGSVMSTISGPSHPHAPPFDGNDDLSVQRLADQKAGAQTLCEGMPYNPLKATDLGLAAGHHPQTGPTIEPHSLVVSASTVQEDVASEKLGEGVPVSGVNPTNGPLDRVRVDSGGQALTTNHGVKVADNQNSLKAGLRGPTLLEDFVLREKITHFDHERIPERVVHARGSAAHGVFECYESLAAITCADVFSQAGKRTPVFTRFSTVAGSAGSADTARDTRGFAVKFYTRVGNWDLVGNNMPVFFIQDAMKFPDLIHAVKPEPNSGFPQASSAHDTFWDFISLSPESIHHIVWQMSDRAIPRSLRMMQGFGVHSFRFVNAEGESVFVKFHWLPVAGTHSLVWDEAVKIAGADADFHRRDLWEAIEGGGGPEWELALQVFTDAQADAFSFDVLDATKLVPEELIPLRVVGKMTLNRNPDNYFAETEQVAFCTAHVVPGIDFSNDPLLQGRIHSYLDTQISRLGGANFHELPINAPIAEVHNNQRDGMHRQSIARGRVAYEPNSLGGGCPFQAGAAGFVSFPQPVSEDKVRGKPDKFADHYSQAQLFWRSQTPTEQQHIIAAFRFELTRVGVPAIRTRMVSVLVNVDPLLAASVAAGLGLEVPPAQPLAREPRVRSEVDVSPTLSLFARPGDGSVRGRRVALLVADGVDAGSLQDVHTALLAAQAVPRYIGLWLGRITSDAGDEIEVESSLEAMPSVLWDAVVVPGGDAALAGLCASARVIDFLKEQYRHCKPILVLDGGTVLLQAAGIPVQLAGGAVDPGLVLSDGNTRPLLPAFMAALTRHRHYEREFGGATV